MGKDEEQQGSRGFKVEDRRRFTDAGVAREDDPEVPPPPDTPQAASTARESPSATQATDHHAGSHEPDFSTFLLSLSTQALAHLGEIPDPFTKQISVDLDAARQMIDILGILKEKTKNNLDSAESQLMEHLLYDLRLRFVERSRH